MKVSPSFVALAVGISPLLSGAYASPVPGAPTNVGSPALSSSPATPAGSAHDTGMFATPDIVNAEVFPAQASTPKVPATPDVQHVKAPRGLLSVNGKNTNSNSNTGLGLLGLGGGSTSQLTGATSGLTGKTSGLTGGLGLSGLTGGVSGGKLTDGVSGSGKSLGGLLNVGPKK